MAKLTDWEIKKDLIIAKNIALYEIITGESVIPSEKCFSTIMYSVYLLRAMGLHMGDHGYNIVPENNRGLFSSGLRFDLDSFVAYYLLDDAREYLLHDSKNGTTEKIARFLMESRSCIGTEYSQTEYIGAMANAYHVSRIYANEKDVPESDILYVVRHHTPFSNKKGNARALESAKSLMRR